MNLTLKNTIAKLVRIPLLHRLMLLGIRVFVPRQRMGIVMVVLDEQDRVLMLRHVFHPNFPWGLPGGWLGRNESPAEAVVREVKEETGLTAVLGPVVQVRREDHPPHIGMAYMGRVLPGEIKLSGEIIEAAWFAVDELPEPLLPFMRDAILKAVQRSYLLDEVEMHCN